MRSLQRDGQRTLLAIACVASGVLAFVSLQLVAGMVGVALTTHIRETNGADVSVQSDIVPITQRQVDALARLRSLDVITDYTATSEQQAETTYQRQSQFYTLYAIDPAHFPLIGSPALVAPHAASFRQALNGSAVVLTSSLSGRLHAGVGARIVVVVRDGHTIHATVGGVVANTGFFNGAKLFIALDAYQALPSAQNGPAAYTAVYANVPDHLSSDANTAKRALETLDPLATSVTTSDDALRQSEGEAHGIRVFLQSVELLALLIAGVGIQNTMRVILQRRLPEIAILKTCGYGQRHLYLLFGVEAALVGLCGGAVGALGGALLSRAIAWLIERTFLLQLPATLDIATLLSGLLAGCIATWLFGMLPVVQASQLPPMAILRERTNERSRRRAGVALTYAATLIALVFVLILMILDNPRLAALVILAASGVLIALGALFTSLALATVRLPRAARAWGHAGSIAGTCAMAYALAQTIAPVLGFTFLVLALTGVLVAFPPRAVQSFDRLALRNIGRTPLRSVFLLLVVFFGVFCTGAVLVMGAFARAAIQSVPVTLVKYNSFVLAPDAQRHAVETALSHASDVQASIVNVVAQDVPVAIGTVPFDRYLHGAPDNPTAKNLGRYQAEYYLSGVEGYALDTGSFPTVRIIRGNQDSRAGRNLARSDVGSTAVVMPYAASLPPLNLRLDERFTITSRSGRSHVALTIVGFYLQNYDTFNSAPIFADQSLAMLIGDQHPALIFSLRLPPSQADATLRAIGEAVPSAQTFTLVDLVNSIDSLLANFIQAVTVVAALTLAASLVIVANAVGLSTFERRREIGILKALGYTSHQVVALLTAEFALISLIAGALAMLLVIIGVTVAAKVTQVSSAAVSAPLALGIVGAVTLVSTLVVALVAWRPAHERPAIVLRRE